MFEEECHKYGKVDFLLQVPKLWSLFYPSFFLCSFHVCPSGFPMLDDV